MAIETVRLRSAQDVGQGPFVDEGEALGGAGERDVERPGALHLLLEDRRGLDHDGGVELEALDQARPARR